MAKASSPARADPADPAVPADPAHPAPPDRLSRPVAERFAHFFEHFFEHFIDTLRACLLTPEILAAEVVRCNRLTAILQAELESWGFDAQQVIGGSDLARKPGLQDVTTLLVARAMSPALIVALPAPALTPPKDHRHRLRG